MPWYFALALRGFVLRQVCCVLLCVVVHCIVLYGFTLCCFHGFGLSNVPLFGVVSLDVA